MCRSHALLWGVILVTTVADILLTIIGLEAGYREGNVMIAAVLSEFGLAGLWLIKFAAMLWLVCGWLLLNDWNAAVFLGLFAVVTSAVVVSNAIVVFV
jgi:hypothetical protein